jgi:hypothetical protein
MLEMVSRFNPEPSKSRISISGTDAPDTGVKPDVESPLDMRHLSILPAQVLHPNEIIVLLLKPSLWFVVLSAWRMLAVLTALFAMGFLFDPQGQHTGLVRSELALVYGFLLVVRISWQFMEWLGHVYILTDKRVITSIGFLRPISYEAPLGRIHHSELFVSKTERMFELGTIGYTTHASKDHFVTQWKMLSRPAAVYDAVVRAIDRYRG